MTTLPCLVSSRRDSTISRVTNTTLIEPVSEADLSGELRRWSSTRETFDDRSLLSTPTREYRRTALSAPVTADAFGRIVGLTEDRYSRQQNTADSRPVCTQDWERIRGKRLLPPINTTASVSSSWLWKEDHVSRPKVHHWTRDYRSFTHSNYLPPCKIPRKEMEEKRWKIKCKAWLVAHQYWLQ